ncbi:hypothetical protein D3C76_1734820 [compost metagenome]
MRLTGLLLNSNRLIRFATTAPCAVNTKNNRQLKQPLRQPLTPKSGHKKRHCPSNNGSTRFDWIVSFAVITKKSN